MPLWIRNHTFCLPFLLGVYLYVLLSLSIYLSIYYSIFLFPPRHLYTVPTLSTNLPQRSEYSLEKLRFRVSTSTYLPFLIQVEWILDRLFSPFALRNLPISSFFFLLFLLFLLLLFPLFIRPSRIRIRNSMRILSYVDLQLDIILLALKKIYVTKQRSSKDTVFRYIQK